MSYSTLIGRRITLSKQNRLLVNLSTWIAVVGVALGVASLVVVNAVYDGYNAEMRQAFMKAFTHVEIAAPGGVGGRMPASDSIFEYLEEQPGVVAVSPVIKREVLLMPRSGLSRNRVGALVLGLDPVRSAQISDLLTRSVEGASDLGEHDLLVGNALGERLGVEIGDRVIVLTEITQTERGRPRAEREVLQVAGFFESGFHEFDERVAVVGIDVARRMFDVQSHVTDIIQVRTEDPLHAEEVADALARAMPGSVTKTWEEHVYGFFASVEVTRIAVLIILLMLVMVAAANVIGSLVMMVHDRTRDIGIIRAMGGTRSALLRTFLVSGGMIGGLGVIVGVVFGLALCWFLATVEIFDIPESVYFIDHMPILIDGVKLAAVCVVTFLICLVAAAAPALRAAHLDPVEALRHE